MKQLSQLMTDLPMSVRRRVMAAIFLMMGFPVLGGTLVVCDRFQQRTYGIITISIVMGLCLLLSWCGFWQIRTLMLSIVDIRDFIGEIVRLHRKAGEKANNAVEIKKMEQLIRYLQNQMEVAQGLIQHHMTANNVFEARATTTCGSYGSLNIHLPPLIPRAALASRIQLELSKADEQQSNVCVMVCEADMVTPAETADDSFVPSWLRALLLTVGGPLKTMGRVRAGRWVLVLDGTDRERTNEIVGHIQAWAADPTHQSVRIRICRYPDEKFDLTREIAAT